MKKNFESIFNVVIGTAGHIDHGKSTLIHRLTGVDPDRLPEEKARGLTIDLGFAPLVLPDGRRVGVVDVPGHERLVKNMVAGATGIDLVLLVVAADDSVMPQTREHLTILQVLGHRHGIVVVTKIDLVDPELRELVREEVRESLAGTFLEDAPVVELSSVTGEGIDELLATLYRELEKVKPREATGVFRMPVQRVFSLKGFGTVVTGIPLSGTVKLGDTLEVVPLGQRGRIRGIQAYKEGTDLARAGHSTAINLTDVDYREVRRGMVVAEPGYFRGSEMFEAKLRYLPTGRRPLEHQTPVRLHVGTVEAIGRVYLLERKELAPGEEGFVQFRLEEPIVAAPGDRYVLRLYSPAETIGGGEILSLSRWRLKTGKKFVIDELRGREAALDDVRDYLATLVEGEGFATVSEKDLSLSSGRAIEEVRSALDDLLAGGRILRSGRAGQFLSAKRLDEARERAREVAAAYHRENPYRLLMERSHLRKSLRASDVFLQDLLDRLAADEEIQSADGNTLRWRDHGPRLDAADAEIREQVIGSCREESFTPPSPEELAARRGWDPRRTKEIYGLLVEEGELLELADGIYFHRGALDDARARLREHLRSEGSMTAADAKNVLSSTRKYSIPLLEFLDREGFTVRRGDLRVLKEARSE